MADNAHAWIGRQHALNALGRKTNTGAGVEAVLAAIGKKI